MMLGVAWGKKVSMSKTLLPAMRLRTIIQAIMADSSIVALHSLKRGPKRVLLPGTRNVRDVVSGQSAGDNVKALDFVLDAPATRGRGGL